MWDFVSFRWGPKISPAQRQVLTQAIHVLVRFVKEYAGFGNRDPVQYVELTKMATESRNGVKITLFVAENWGWRQLRDFEGPQLYAPNELLLTVWPS